MPEIVATLAGSAAALAAVSLPLGAWSAHARRQIERSYPPIGRFVDVPGARLHYLERGTGPEIVLLHGASTNLRDFMPTLVEPLAEDHRVVVFDRPGYGYSTRPRGPWLDPARQAALLHHALSALGVSRPVLVGHSWAASLVLAYALAYPVDVAGLVTLSGATHPWRGGVSLMRNLAMLPAIGPWLAATVVWPLGRTLVEAGIRGALQPHVPAETYRRQTAIDLQLRANQFLADAHDVGRLSPFLAVQARRYPEIDVPLCVITGTRDAVVSPRLHSHSLHEQLPKSRLVVIDGAGHAPHHSHAEDVITEIRALARAARDG